MTLRQREPRVRDEKYLAFLRTLRCTVCNRPAPSEAAHIRMACLEIGKPITGMGTKPDDRYAVPLCSWCHREAPESQHNIGDEAKFWRLVDVDPFAVAARLYALGGGNGTIQKPKKRPKPKPTIKAKIPSRPFPKSITGKSRNKWKRAPK